MPSSPAARESGRKNGTRLRATCDACKDAKVRCNRDVPTCYRCRNQKLNCVYNLSRRMGRPRRNRSDAESGKARAEDEHDRAQGPIHRETSGGKDETATADPATLRGCSSRKQSQEHGKRPGNLKTFTSPDHTGRSDLNNAETQNSSSMSSLMDPFGSPHDYDPNQLQTPTGLSDYDHMVEFDFLDSPGPSIPPGSANPGASRVSHWMRPQSTSIFDGDSIREQSNTSRPVALSLSDPSADTITNGDMMPIVGLEERPLSSSGFTFDMEQTHARRNSGYGTPSIVGKRGESGAAPKQSTMCECYQNILQKLSSIDENQCEIFSTIDVALVLEQCVQSHIAKVLECGTCAIKRPTILLLLAIIVDNVVCLLESSSRFGSSSSTVEYRSRNHSPITHDSPTAPTSFRTPQVADMTGAGKSATSLAMRTTADKPPLLVGSYEILSEEKNKFLKQLLQGRLSSLSATLRQLMPYMQRGSPQNSNSRHGTIMMAETYKRLQSVIGRVELWDG